ncbi:TraB/GumN family protein [Candidatus Woesearchaeota archaeon]|nr:TraB/GumN family protein [Candidatus Woesearchaeota archaeon]
MTLNIIGTSHIAKESILDVRNAFDGGSIDILALELDDGRLRAILDRDKLGSKHLSFSFRDVRNLGVKTYLFARFISWAETYLGRKVGISPGSEMLQAFKLAKKNNVSVALVDQDVRITLKKLRGLSWKEYWNFFVDLFKGVLAGFGFISRKSIPGFEVLHNLEKVPSDDCIEKILLQTKFRYPTIYRVLVSERNRFIARRIASLQHQNPGAKILAVIGAGHKKEVEHLYNKYMNMDYIKR